MNTATVREATKHAAESQTGSCLCVNIGCGVSGADGWYNIDNSPTILLSRLPWGSRIFRVPAWPRSVHRHDVLKGLPFGDNTVDHIYSSHTFEHFTYAQSLKLTKDCLRVLKPGGILRIVVPDLRQVVDDYLVDPNPMASHRLMERLSLGHDWRDFLHPGSHHSQMFDSRSLVAMLEEAGFPNPRPSQFGDSRIPGLLKVELEDRRHGSLSLYVEAEKGELSRGEISVEKSA